MGLLVFCVWDMPRKSSGKKKKGKKVKQNRSEKKHETKQAVVPHRFLSNKEKARSVLIADVRQCFCCHKIVHDTLVTCVECNSSFVGYCSEECREKDQEKHYPVCGTI